MLIYFQGWDNIFLLLVNIVIIFNFFFFRRELEDDLTFLDWDEALSREDVHALIICTENDTHEEYARWPITLFMWFSSVAAVS